MSVVEIKGVTKQFGRGGTTALQGIDLAIEEREFVSLIGPSGCGRSIGIRSEMRPGRADMTTTRVERKTASAIECVTKTIVEPLASQIRRSSMFSRSRVISSSAPKGSSMSRSAGSKESARAIETRCCIPPESCHG